MSVRPDIRVEGYGFKAEGPWKILSCEAGEGESRFRIAAQDLPFVLKVPGRHTVLDAVGALALARSVVLAEGRISESEYWQAARKALADFRGSRRRSEILGEAGSVLFVDDYAHHPTALATTIAGFRSFWPSRRLVVDFMSHTYSRTLALLDEFASSLSEPDCIVLHGIYASAREPPSSSVSGRSLYDKVRALRPELEELLPGAAAGWGKGFILYTERHADALESLDTLLQPGDLFVTMGAGDNWKLGRALMERKGT